jgi:ABC-type transport system involved in multi-copper enzyme maturation permease subunit
MTILIIAASVVNRLLRNKSLIIVSVVALIIIALSSAPLAYSIEQAKLAIAEGKPDFLIAAKDTATGWFNFVPNFMWAFAALAGLMASTGVITQDIREGTIFSVLSKPVERREYLFGNYLGNVIFLGLVWGILMVVYFSFIYLISRYLGPQQWKLHLIFAAARFLELIVVSSIAFAMAQRFSPLVAGAISVVFYNGGALEQGSAYLFNWWKMDVPYWVSQLIAFPFPTTESLDIIFKTTNYFSTSALGDLFFSAVKNPANQGALLSSPAWVMLHLADYGLIMMLMAWWLFSRKEISPANE